MTEHDLAEQTSLALHREVARQLRRDPRLLARARERVRTWGEEVHPYYRERWAELLARPPEEVCTVLEAETEEARELRQASPFAGALDSATRWRIWRQVRRR